MSSVAERKPELDKYELAEEIGHGGMATVYRAHDPRLERDVAVKVIHRHLRENKEVAARFVSEARAVAKVKHPNVVEVYDVSDERDDERYLVVELVRGTTLRKLLNEHGYLPSEVAAAIGIEIAAGLDFAHEQGVIHRDVKPENVLVGAMGPTSGRDSADRTLEGRVPIVKITDFGIAKLLDAQGVTSTGQVLGSPAHMAPEQIEGGDVTARSDVFGLGVLLYECMVGKLPFDGKNPAQVLRRVLDGAFTSPERARPTIGAEWSRILSRAIAHESSERWPGCAEFAAAMRQELSRLGIEDPRRELGEFLSEPEAYLPEYEKRIVARLAELGRGARRERKVAVAASCFNRALAFRPDDTELLGEVTRLARLERLKRNALRIGAIAGVSALLGVGAFAATRAFRSSVEATQPSATIPVKAEPPKKPHTGPVAPSATASAAPEKKRIRIAAQPIGVIPPPAKGGTRQVRVIISGAAGGKLSIDGNPEQWLGVLHELAVGPHTFELTPPDAECCETPAPIQRDIPAGDDTLELAFRIPFKPAIIRTTMSADVSCGLLGRFTGPGGQLTVPLNTPKLSGRCTVIPLAGSTEAPKTIDVTLSPGRTFTIPGP